MSNIRPLSDELAKMAKSELNEVPSRIKEDIQQIRNWISKQPHLKPICNDQFLINFLRGCKYSLERTKQKIDKYFTIKTTMPEIFSDRDPTDPNLLKIIRLGTILVLPLTNKPDGPTTILVRTGIYGPGELKSEDLIKVYTMIADVLTRDNDNLVISGEMIFYDLTNTGWATILSFDLASIKKVVTILQDAMPARLKGLHIYQPPTGFETFANVIRSLLSEKNKKRVMVHGDNIDGLYKYIPKKILPTEYGGEAGPIQDIIDDWERKLLANKNYFKELDKNGSNEAKRVREGVVSGSFRKLDVD